MNGMKIACVIPTYNNYASLCLTVENLLSQTRPPDIVYIIDNASADGTAEIKKRFPGVEYVRLAENQGSAGGYYEGIKLAGEAADLVFLSDDDNLYRPDALEQLEKGLLKLGGRAGAVRCAWEAFKGKEPAEVPDALWSGALITSAVVKKIGLPLRELFLYAEDVEYFRRMRRSGFAVYVIPGAGYLKRYAGHKMTSGWFGRPTHAYRDAFRLYYAFRNEIYVSRLYGAWWKVFRTVLYLFKILVFLSPSSVLAALDGIRDGFAGRLGKNGKYHITR
ncbi:MAG: glycosyltransferase [Elusimicrobia bacterium]|nr:glycosyltransferase [Elusimicrobiota bacterium]